MCVGVGERQAEDANVEWTVHGGSGRRSSDLAVMSDPSFHLLEVRSSLCLLRFPWILDLLKTRPPPVVVQQQS